MKVYVYIGFALALMAFSYWAYNAVYSAGFNAAEAKYQIGINKANKEYKDKQSELIKEHIKELKDVKSKTNARIRSLKEAKDTCLSVLMPASVIERVREERKAYDN